MNWELWDKARSFHGHECPGLAIGVKACEAAIEKLGVGTSDDENLVCITENDACGVDAVQALLSCTMGKGNLILRPTGKMAFSFFDRTNGRQIRMVLIARNNGMERATYIQYLLDAPVDELFKFTEPGFSLPERARLFQSVTCEVCGESAPEHKMRLQDGKKVCLDCFKDYHRGW